MPRIVSFRLAGGVRGLSGHGNLGAGNDRAGIV